jgi:hypothetical protein
VTLTVEWLAHLTARIVRSGSAPTESRMTAAPASSAGARDSEHPLISADYPLVSVRTPRLLLQTPHIGPAGRPPIVGARSSGKRAYFAAIARSSVSRMKRV